MPGFFPAPFFVQLTVQCLKVPYLAMAARIYPGAARTGVLGQTVKSRVNSCTVRGLRPLEVSNAFLLFQQQALRSFGLEEGDLFGLGDRDLTLGV